MKNMLLGLVFIVFINCINQQNFYRGYVYDMTTKMPLYNVLIKENLKENSKSGRSDRNGYFEILNDTESSGNLIFSLEDYKSDTINTVWSQHGEKLKYRFINSKNDTLYMQKKIVD